MRKIMSLHYKVFRVVTAPPHQSVRCSIQFDNNAVVSSINNYTFLKKKKKKVLTIIQEITRFSLTIFVSSKIPRTFSFDIFKKNPLSLHLTITNFFITKNSITLVNILLFI